MKVYIYLIFLLTLLVGFPTHVFSSFSSESMEQQSQIPETRVKEALERFSNLQRAREPKLGCETSVPKSTPKSNKSSSIKKQIPYKFKPLK